MQRLEVAFHYLVVRRAAFVDPKLEKMMLEQGAPSNFNDDLITWSSMSGMEFEEILKVLFDGGFPQQDYWIDTRMDMVSNFMRISKALVEKYYPGGVTTFDEEQRPSFWSDEDFFCGILSDEVEPMTLDSFRNWGAEEEELREGITLSQGEPFFLNDWLCGHYTGHRLHVSLRNQVQNAKADA